MFCRLRKYQGQLTSEDVLKSIAMIFMIIDHVGFYLFPDILFLRMIGRFSAPIWLFLIGYHFKSRNVKRLQPLFIGGTLLLIVHMILGLPLFPLNILFTIMLISGAALPLARPHHYQSPRGFLDYAGIMILLLFPTLALFDYGSVAILWAFFGMVLAMPNVPHSVRLMAAATVWGAYVFIQSLIFALPVLVMIIFAVGMIALIAGLWLFTDYAAQKQWKASILAIPIQIMGRYSLEIYVLHVCLFHVIRLLFFQNPNPITGTS
jgi:hypothetical protein